jgi:hypothetical protein
MTDATDTRPRFIEGSKFTGVQYPRWPNNPRSPLDTSMVQCECGRHWNAHRCVDGACPEPEVRHD